MLRSSYLSCLLMLCWAFAPIAEAGQQDFLEVPITGTKKILFYWLKYPNPSFPPGEPFLPVAPSHDDVTPGCPLIGSEQFEERIAQILEANSYGRLDIQWASAAGVAMPNPIGYYDSGLGDNQIRVLRDARGVVSDPQGPYQLNPLDFDYEVILTKEFWSGGPQTGIGFNKNFRVSFVSDSGPATLLDVALHEIGHGFKFEHSSYWIGDPSQSVLGCLEEYGDHFDIMGRSGNFFNGCERHYNPRHKLAAGWMPAGVALPFGLALEDAIYPVVTQSGVYTLRALEDGSTSPEARSLRIRQDSEWTYSITYRAEDPAADSQCVPGGSCNGALITKSRNVNLRPEGNTVLLNPLKWLSGGCLTGGWNPSCSAPPPSMAPVSWCKSVLLEGEEYYAPDFYGPGLGLKIKVRRVFDDRIKVKISFLDMNGHEVDGQVFGTPPVIEILAPTPSDGPEPGVLTGTIQVKIVAYDPDSGTDHFDGISQVVLTAGDGPGTVFLPDPLSPDFLLWDLDTSTLPDGASEFHVEAHEDGPSGDVREIRYRFYNSNP